VIQGDTEPASVEQQRHLGKTAPSLYDMRNLFQVNVEEGRHLWAMVYLLHKYFGKPTAARRRTICCAANRAIEGSAAHAGRLQRGNAGLAVVLHVHLLHRPRRQDAAGKPGAVGLRSAVSRTCRFMLTEEAHHMFVGETGVGRTIQRTCEVMKENGIDDPYDIDRIRNLGVIDLPTIQKKLNLHYTLSLDLFGSGNLDQRRQRLQRRHQGPLHGSQAG
jgi:benzoyl-CoA 2,3-dioxygenase component B